jgi:predicted amidophosphoribosyltransferase
MRCVVCKRKLERTVCEQCEKDLEIVKNKEQLIAFLERKAEENGREDYD